MKYSSSLEYNIRAEGSQCEFDKVRLMW
jgi:hypothetical protein